MMSGSGRFETDAMEIFGPRLFVKGGAEGVCCGAFPDLGLGIAIKCDDGAGRAADVAMAAAIEAFLMPTEDDNERFADRLVVPVLNRRGIEVGELRPVAGLVEALRTARAIS